MIEELNRHGIDVLQVMPGNPASKREWARETWIICRAPSDSTYMDKFDTIEAFIARYRKRYPC